MEVMKSEEEGAEVEIWKYVFGFSGMGVVKCAIELEIADVIERHGGGMSLTDLSSALACSPSAVSRVMRYLIHRGFFKLHHINQQYMQTPLSRLLIKSNSSSMAAFLLLESTPVMLAPWHTLTSRLLINGPPRTFDVWEYASANPGHSKLINDAMACHARRAVSAILDHYPQVFQGIASLVDVGGGNATALGAILKACPWICAGINFDLPHVVATAAPHDLVQHVGGNMFECVPKADAAFLMWVLHDWGDDECVRILRKCRDAIPKETGKVIIAEAVVVGDGEKETGKVIIAEAVVVGDGEEDKYKDVRLALDMVMLAHTHNGKERTIQEWETLLLKGAGFSSYTLKHIGAIICVIEAYP